MGDSTGRVRGLAASVLLALAAPAAAGDGEAELFDLSLEQLLDVPLQTGTRFAPRSAGDAPVALSSFSAAELASTGRSDLSEALQRLLPSWQATTEPIDDGSSFVRPFHLRGLPPDQTLVLVDGKRRHRGALVQLLGGPLAQGAQGPDIADLPLIALDRVEVLRDGSAAQYGSDAIAGVVNIILRDDLATEVRAQYGDTSGDGGDERRLAAYHGARLGADGRWSLALEAVDRDEFSRTTSRPDVEAYRAGGLTLPDPVMVGGAPERRSRRALWRFEQPLAAATLYGFGNWSRTRHDGSFYYRNLEQDFFTRLIALDSGDVLPCPEIADDAFGLERARRCRALAAADPNLFSFLQWYPAGFTPRFAARIDDAAQQLGLRGDRGATHWDLSLGCGRQAIDYAIRNTINPSLGPDSPTAFAPGALSQSERSARLELSRPFAALQLAGGIEWRDERYRIAVGDPASWQIGPYPTLGIGSNGFPGYDPQQAGRFARSSRSLYLDSEWRPSADWLLAAALRHERYSDFGNTSKGKLALRRALGPHLALRGALSTGFRAPTPGQSSTTNVRTVYDAALNRPIAVGLIPPGSDIARYFGAGPLRPETSINRSLGLVWTGAGLSASLDLFRIDVADRIALGSEIDITPELRAQLIAAGLARAGDFGRIQFFANTFDTRSEGVEAELQWLQTHATGRTRWRLDASWIDTRVTRVGDRSVITEDRQTNLEHLLPRAALVASGEHRRGAWTLLARLRFDGPWR